MINLRVRSAQLKKTEKKNFAMNFYSAPHRRLHQSHMENKGHPSGQLIELFEILTITDPAYL